MTFPARRRRRLVPAAAGLAVAAIALTACSSSADTASPSGSASATTQETETLSLALHFNSPQASWVGIYVAQQEGYYADAGIELDIQYLASSTLAVQAVGSGSATIGIAAPDALLAGAVQDLPLVAVANHIQQDATGVIVNGAASSIADLAGMTIATAQGTAESGLFQAALTQAGITDDVTINYVESSAKCTLMISGQADACTGFSYSQLVQAELAGVEATFLPFSTDEDPLPGAAIFTTQDEVDNDSDLIERFLEATYQGYRDADADREMAVALMQETADTADPDQIAEATERVLDLTRSDVTDENGWGWSSTDVWQNLVDELTAGGVLTSDVDPADLLTNDLLPEEASSWR
ncbi:MAG TPA: ABC transporter substrate-binding protein [Cellulomonas sp.]